MRFTVLLHTIVLASLLPKVALTQNIIESIAERGTSNNPFIDSSKEILSSESIEILKTLSDAPFRKSHAAVEEYDTAKSAWIKEHPDLYKRIVGDLPATLPNLNTGNSANPKQEDETLMINEE